MTLALTRVTHLPPHAHTEPITFAIAPLTRVRTAVRKCEFPPAIGFAVLSFSYFGKNG